MSGRWSLEKFQGVEEATLDLVCSGTQCLLQARQRQIRE